MKLFRVIISFFFIIVFSNVSAQLLPNDSLKINLRNINLPHPETNYLSLSILAASSITSGLLLHNYQYNSWWSNNTNNFKIINSLNRNNWINKAGKFYSTNLIAHFYSASLEYSGIEYEKATIYSAVIAFAYGLYIESYDGFAPSYGFNASEIVFNAFGAGYVLGQYYIPELKNFQPRISYYPSNAYSNNSIKNKNIFSDFGGQKYWMGIRVKNYLPDKIADYWPSFLMVSVGMGTNNYDANNSGYDLFVALDIDAEAIPLYGSFWQFLKNTLNYLHFPMPGIRITPNTAAFLLCY